MLVILPPEECFASEDPTGELLCPLENLCMVPGLASAVRDRDGSESFPPVSASRLLEIPARFSKPLECPKRFELDNYNK